MLFHLPIVILATLSPTTISDTPPRLDVTKECRFESDSPKAFDRCTRDEADALQQVGTEWSQFVDADRRSCLSEATAADSPSYVELLTCLEMARDVRKQQADPASPETGAVDKHE
jgi:hypothetical protein